MKILILTVAGLSTRFSKSIGKDVLKCIYYEKSVTESLLYRMLHQPVDFDKYIIVGGYEFDLLKAGINQDYPELCNKIELVYNEHFADYGSGYSLYCGIKKALNFDFDDIVFAEGDLFVDTITFQEVANSKKNVVTTNDDPILANKAVAFYIDRDKKIRYIYDTSHESLKIDEEFLGIFNSGQIWKFSDRNLVKVVYDSLEEVDWTGTNLVMVERYFRMLNEDEYESIRFKKWINCNTVDDFIKSQE